MLHIYRVLLNLQAIGLGEALQVMALAAQLFSSEAPIWRYLGGKIKMGHAANIHKLNAVRSKLII